MHLGDRSHQAVIAPALLIDGVKTIPVDKLFDQLGVAHKVPPVGRVLQVQRASLLAGPGAVGVHARPQDATARAAHEEQDQERAWSVHTRVDSQLGTITGRDASPSHGRCKHLYTKYSKAEGPIVTAAFTGIAGAAAEPK
jgi:hypothetical protein